MPPRRKTVGARENQMRRTNLLVAFAVLLIAVSAGAELSPSFKDWPNGPIGFLMTSAEKKAFAGLAGDAEAQAFIELFWAKRDPNLDTLINEFQEDFNRRVEFADKTFTWDKAKGSLTDRGKVFLLFGAPTAGRQVSDAAQHAVDGLPDAMQVGGAEIWAYTKPDAKNPKDMTVFVFQESRVGMKDFGLDRGDSRNRMAMKALANRPDELIKNPKLTEVPRQGLVSGSKAATSSQLAILDGRPRPTAAGVTMMAVSGVQSDTLHPIWIHVEVPDALPPVATAIGRLQKETGEAAGSFAIAATAISITGARCYEFSLGATPGKFTAEVALLDAGNAPIAIVERTVATEAALSEGTYISPMYVGVEVRQRTDSKAGDPFVIGGWHVIPRVTGSFVPSEQLSYFCFVANPALDEQKTPVFELGMKLFIDDHPAGDLPLRAIQLSRISDTLWMFGSSLPLANFTKPATYRLEVTLKDTKSSALRMNTIVFSIPRLEGAAAPAVK